MSAMDQKVHWIDGGKYSQSKLTLDTNTGLAWLWDNKGNLIKPARSLTIHAGPRAIRKHIYQAAIKAGYLVLT